MTDRPIIFSGPMVKALLAGRKTQTRRVLNPPYGFLEYLRDGTWRPICTKFFPGDRLYVRESACWVSAWGWRYRADNDDLTDKRESGEVGRWRPSIHMPRSASRITLTVTEVRVERLQEISNEDAIAEGIKPHGHAFTGYGNQSDVWMAPYDSFRSLWNSLHGPDAWDANPWVVAVSFTVDRQNIDHLPTNP